MLVNFKGKGCRNCPCLQESMTCGLSGRDGMDVGEILPVFKPNLEQKPKDCPFAKYPNTLEIVAWEND